MKKIIILAMATLFGVLQIKFVGAQSFQENLESSMENINVIDIAMPALAEDESSLENLEASGINDKAAAEKINIFEYFDRSLGMEKTPKPMVLMPAKSNAAERILYSFNLSEITNKIFKTAVSFKTAKGTVVYVSGTKAANCPDGGRDCKDREKYFVVLTTDRGEHHLIRGAAVANVFLIMSGSKKVIIDGEAYIVKLHVKVSSPEKSILEIKRGSKKVVNITLEKLGNAIAERSETVKLSKEYKLACGYELIQGKKGAAFTDRLIVGLVSNPPDSYFVLKVSEITKEGVVYPEIDNDIGFRMKEDVLEIYRI